MGYGDLAFVVRRQIDSEIDALSFYPPFKHLKTKKKALFEKYFTKIKKIIREKTGKKRISSTMNTRNVEMYAPNAFDPMNEFYDDMLRLLYKKVLGRLPTSNEYQVTASRAIYNIQKTKPKLFKEKIAVWEKKFLKKLPTDPISKKVFKDGDKAVLIDFGPARNNKLSGKHYISNATFQRLQKFSNISLNNWYQNKFPLNAKINHPGYSYEYIKMADMEFVILKQKK